MDGSVVTTNERPDPDPDPDPDRLAGFTEGEGCFSVGIQKSQVVKMGFHN